MAHLKKFLTLKSLSKCLVWHPTRRRQHLLPPFQFDRVLKIVESRRRRRRRLLLNVT